MTFVAGSVLTAAQLNTHLRDNLLETAPAKATTSGSFFVGTGPNSIAERIVQQSLVSTSQGTASTTYTDLATVGPQSTATTGSMALVHMYTSYVNTGATNINLMTIEVSGATSIAANDQYAIGGDSGTGVRATSSLIVTGLTPGSNTFTAKYRVNAGTGTFQDRRLVVIPL